MFEIALMFAFGSVSLASIVGAALTFANTIDKRERQEDDLERARGEWDVRQALSILPFPENRHKCSLCGHTGSVTPTNANYMHVEWSCGECGGSYTTHPATRNR